MPIVRRTGGLADSVVDATPERLADNSATGFQFEAAEAPALLVAIERALALHARPEAWRRLVTRGMQQDFSWTRSAQHYLELYQQLVAARHV